MGNRTTYEKYLESEHWHGIREEAFNRAGKKCEACKQSRRKMHGHHLLYRNPLTLCTAEDIMALCEPCHNAWHAWLDQKHKELHWFNRESTRETIQAFTPRKKPKKNLKKQTRKPRRKQRPSREYYREPGAPKNQTTHQRWMAAVEGYEQRKIERDKQEAQEFSERVGGKPPKWAWSAMRAWERDQERQKKESENNCPF